MNNYPQNLLTTNKGFTLIELIIVIVILGVLSVTALPKFLDFSSDANDAVFASTVVAFKQGVKHVNYKWLVRGSPIGTAANDLIGNLDVNDIGYPSGIDDARQVSSVQDCIDIFYGTLDSDLSLEVPPGGAGPAINQLSSNVDIAVTIGNSICYYTYISESNSTDFIAPQFQYFYQTGAVVEATYQLD